LSYLTLKTVYDEIQDHCIDSELNLTNFKSSSIAVNTKEPDYVIIRRLIRAEESRILLEKHAAKEKQKNGGNAIEGLGLLGLDEVFHEYDEQVRYGEILC